MDIGEISYEMNIYKNNLLIRSEDILLEQSGYGENEFTINKLLPNTTYSLECIATYKNPNTLRQEQVTIYQEELTTLDVYTYSYSVETFNDYMEVSITLTDPNHYFQNAYYESYDTSGEHDMYLVGETYSFINNGVDKSSTFTINIPITSSYKIEIGIRNQIDFSINEIIDIIIFE